MASYNYTDWIIGLPGNYSNLQVPMGSIITPPTIGATTSLTTPIGQTITVANIGNTTNRYTSADQAFVLSATGLKPNTIHTFKFQGTDVSSACQPAGGTLGSQLITDATGAITFTYFYNSGIVSGTNVTSTQALINNVTGNKIGILSSTDGTSTAQVTITIAASTPQAISSVRDPHLGPGFGTFA